ncbi:MAG: Hsp20/alpha crystallin family protein [Armatimonadota bacterium]|nr:Hsp20/alpha crystallin family protein [Armatimonadota bacterium]
MMARRTPFQELFELQRDLMHLFGRVFGSVTRGAGDFLANTEAFYRDGHLVIRAELAGVDPKSVDVSVAGDVLTIKGEREAPDVPMDDRLFGEIVYGKFERTITLPEGLEADRVKAVWHHGMLEITIPVSQAIRPKKVPVEIAKA